MIQNKHDNTWYAKRRKELRIKTQEIYDESNQIFGVVKITAVQKAKATNMVRELMHNMELVSIREKSKELYDRHTRKYRNYVNQQFHTDKPNQVWVSDSSYFKYENKSYYNLPDT